VTFRACLRLAGATLCPGAGPLFSPAESARAGVGSSPARILIVEDEHIVALGLEATILDAGMEVTGIAATAQEAVELARSTVPDLIIMDIRLAGRRDGVDAARDIFDELGLRCVFATAHHDAATRHRAEHARPLAWVSKPYQSSALLRAISEALRILKT
jgi:two-component system, response regulator PdtaR